MTDDQVQARAAQTELLRAQRAEEKMIEGMEDRSDAQIPTLNLNLTLIGWRTGATP